VSGDFYKITLKSKYLYSEFCVYSGVTVLCGYKPSLFYEFEAFILL
jgi:hypothetical protein